MDSGFCLPESAPAAKAAGLRRTSAVERTLFAGAGQFGFGNGTSVISGAFFC
jgi:hypothetical protein